MFCTKCGKKLDDDSIVCRECEEAEAKAENTATVMGYSFVSPAAAPAPAPIVTAAPAEQGPNTRVAGLGLGIASVVLCFVSAFLVGIFLGISSVDPELGFLALLALPLSIVGIVLGANAIRTFFRVKNEKKPVPIATLILGIYGLVNSISGLSSVFYAVVNAISGGELLVFFDGLFLTF